MRYLNVQSVRDCNVRLSKNPTKQGGKIKGNMEVTYGIAGLVIMAILFAVGAIIKKSGTRKQMFLFAFIVGGIAVGGMLMNIAFFDKIIPLGVGQTLVTTPQQTATAGSGKVICAVEDSTITLSAIDKYKSTAVGGNHRYKVNGAPALTVADAGTFTASPGDALEILWTNGTDSTGYYSAVTKETVPCAGTKTYSKELLANGTITVRVFNEEGNLIDTSGENETLGAGDTANLDIDIQGQYQKGFPYGGIIVAEYNKGNYTDVQVNVGGSEVSVPTVHTLSAVGSATKAFSVGAIESNQKIQGVVYIAVASGVNPGDRGDITLTFYPNDYFINEDTGGSFDGPAIEDENDAQTFAHSTAFTLSVD